MAELDIDIPDLDLGIIEPEDIPQFKKTKIVDDNEGLKRYHQVDRATVEEILLDETFARAPPDALKLPLMAHQQTTVQAIIDIETNRVVPYGDKLVETSAVMVAEPLGSGKTIMSLAVIALQRDPPVIPRIHVNAYVDHTNAINKNNSRHSPSYYRIRYKKYIRTSVVCVAPTVLRQWQNEIARFTNMSVFTIGDVRDLREFQRIYIEGKVNCDILLVKYGHTTGEFTQKSHFGRNMDIAEGRLCIMEELYKMTADACFTRVIYDDYDTVPKDTLGRCVNALFTIYVSTTSRDVKASNVDEFSGLHVGAASRDDVLKNMFRIRSHPNYAERSQGMKIVEFYRYDLESPEVLTNTRHALRALSGPETAMYLEMLNSDVPQAAAAHLKITMKSPMDIFQTLLRHKTGPYIKARNMVAAITICRERNHHELPPDPHTPSTEESTEFINMIKRIVLGVKAKEDGEEKYIPPTAPHLYSESLPKFEMFNIVYYKILEKMYAKYKAMETEYGREVDRIISYLREGSCRVCQHDLKDKPTIIPKCCGVSICNTCFVRSCRINRNTGQSTCTSCRKQFVIDEVILIHKSFDLEALLNETSAFDIAPSPPPEEQPEDPLKDIVMPSGITEHLNKCVALIQLIRGQTPKRTTITYEVQGLTHGEVNTPQPANIKRKFLMFASHEQSLENTMKYLNANNIKFHKLEGTPNQIADIVETFRNDDSHILIVNAATRCAGLNLQFVTDLVLYHMINDRGVSAQVMGRAQRIGRTYNLRVHFLRYHDEDL